MSYHATLKRMESMLESFLDRVVEMKSDRLEVISGINRLDDIARDIEHGYDLTDRIGQWFAEHNRLLETRQLRPAEHNRIGRILTHIRHNLRVTHQSPPAVNKIASEIDRWVTTSFENLAPSEPAEKPSAGRIVLKRGPEHTAPKPAVVETGETERKQLTSIERFERTLSRLTNLFSDYSGNKHHLMSVLDDSLRSATISTNREALILSATVIYYLKQHGYKVEPYVKRLKEAERQQAHLKGGTHA